MAKHRPAKDADTEQVSLRMPSNLLDRLDRMGEPYGVRRNQLILQAVLEYVQRHDQQQPTKPARQ